MLRKVEPIWLFIAVVAAARTEIQPNSIRSAAPVGHLARSLSVFQNAVHTSDETGGKPKGRPTRARQSEELLSSSIEPCIANQRRASIGSPGPKGPRHVG